MIEIRYSYFCRKSKLVVFLIKLTFTELLIFIDEL